MCSLDKKEEEEVWHRPEGVMHFILSFLSLESVSHGTSVFVKEHIGIRLGFLHCRVSPILSGDPHPPLANTAGTGGAIMAKKRGGRGMGGGDKKGPQEDGESIIPLFCFLATRACTSVIYQSALPPPPSSRRRQLLLLPILPQKETDYGDRCGDGGNEVERVPTAHRRI